MSSPGGSYNETDAQEILRRASAMQNSGFMSRDELVRAASELGITPEAVEAAEKQYQEARAEEDLRSQFRLKQRQEFFGSFKVLIVCLVIAYLSFHGVTPEHPIPWVPAVVIAFGIWSLVKNGYFAYAEKSPAWQKSFEDFKVADTKRKQRALSKTNETAIQDILAVVRPEQKLDVIKTLRETTGLPLNEAKNAVDDYYRKHPEILQQNS